MTYLDQALQGAPDPEVLIRALLSDLVPVVGATLGTFHDIVRDPQGLRIGTVISVQPPDRRHAGSQLRGRLYTELIGDGAPALVEGAVPFGQFALFGTDDLPPVFVEQVWSPDGVHSMLSINVEDRGGFVGNVGVSRVTGQEPFDPDDLARIRPWTQTVEGVLRTAHMLRDERRSQEGAIVFRPDGAVWMQGGHTAPLAETAFRDELLSLVRTLPADATEPFDVFVQGSAVRLLRLRGESQAVLATVTPVVPWRVTDIMKLSAAQRKVAAMAARGATASEIARHLGRSVDTVRTHLRNIHHELGIGSRAELTAAVLGAFDNPGAS